MRRRTLAGLAAAAALAVGAAVLLAPTPVETPPPSAAALAFENLAPRLAAARRIEVRQGERTLLVERAEGETWTLPALAGYPARPERVRELLTGLTELRLTEPRTANPDLLGRLGLDEPGAPGSTAAGLRVLDAAGAPVAELVIGRRRTRLQGGVPESAYVRRPGEPQAWLAEGRLPVDADPQLWVEREVSNIPRERVRRVVASRPEGVVELVRGPDPDSPLAVLRPEDFGPTDDFALDDAARAFEGLTLLDVRREAEVPGEPLGESRFELTDNLALVARLHRDGERLWARLAAEGDDEAARLNARWRGWAYQLGAWKERALLPAAEGLRPRER